MYTRAFAFFVGYTRRDSKGEQYAYHSSRDRECALSRHVLQYRIHLKHVVAEYMVMLVLYPVIIIMMIDNQSTLEYFTNAREAIPNLGDRIAGLQTADITMFAAGLAGIIIAGLSIRFLRKSGYQMF